MPKLYHGSHTAGIESLYANSKLHNSDEQVVYLTDSRLYALFYIWDEEHNISPTKHVTCRIKNGVVEYEEQFPNQLAAFYKGVSGYLYHIEQSEAFLPVEGRESMWYSKEDACVSSCEFIPDVYEEMLRYQEKGLLKMIRFEELSPEWVTALYEHLAQFIAEKGLLKSPDDARARFYSRFFPKAWEMAKNMRD